MNNKVTYEQIIKTVAEEINLPEEVINNTYKAFWKYIKTTAEQLPLKNIDSESYDSLRTSFNIPSLGKFACTKDKFDKLKKTIRLFTE